MRRAARPSQGDHLGCPSRRVEAAKTTAVTGALLLLAGSMVAPFLKDTIGRLLIYALAGGGAIALVLFVIIGLALIASRDE